MSRTWRWLVAVVLCSVAAGALASPVSFADLARHAQFEQVKISPDGTHIALTAVLADGQTVLSLMNLATMKGKYVKPRGDDNILGFWWISPKYVVFSESQRLGGWDRPVPTGELYSVQADSRGATILFGYRLGGTSIGSHIQHASAERASAQFLSRIDGDPDHLLITVTDWDNPGSTWVERMDVRNGDLEEVARPPMPEASFLADHHGHVRFAMGTDQATGQTMVYLRPESGGTWTLLKKASADHDWPMAFSADDKTVWFQCPGASAGMGVCKFDPATHVMTHVWSNPNVAATGLERGLAEDSIIGVRFDDGRPAISVFNDQAPGVKALEELMHQYPGEDAQFVSGTADGSKAIALVQADIDPGTYFLYDRANNKFTALMQRKPWIHLTELGSVEPFDFTTRDGLHEQGYVTYPPGMQKAKDLPMVVFVHGGPYGIRDYWEYDPYVQALATRGYAVLQVNFRGSGGYGYAFEQAGKGQWGGKMQDDVTDATRWAIRQGIADPHRICIYGGSYGGYAALEGAVEEPDLYKCTIGYVGVYNLPAMLDRKDAAETLYATQFWKRMMGTDRTDLQQHSPIYQLNNLKAKVMLIVGGRDTIVPPSQGKDLRMALLSRGITPVWLYKADEWHGFYNEKNIAELFQDVDQFLAANIGPGAQAKAAAAPASATKH